MDKETIKIEDLIDNERINNKPKLKFNFLSLLSKKNLKIIILLIVGLIAIVLFFSISKENKKTSSSSEKINSYTSTMNYCKLLENKLQVLLSNVKGAGNVSVMVSVDGSPELVYAMDSDVKTSSNINGTTSTNSSTPIIVEINGSYEPLILTENLPKVKGVIVVSSGADDIAVKLNILQAVSTLLDISTEKISVMKGL